MILCFTHRHTFAFHQVHEDPFLFINVRYDRSLIWFQLSGVSMLPPSHPHHWPGLTSGQLYHELLSSPSNRKMLPVTHSRGILRKRCSLWWRMLPCELLSPCGFLQCLFKANAQPRAKGEECVKISKLLCIILSPSVGVNLLVFFASFFFFFSSSGNGFVYEWIH